MSGALTQGCCQAALHRCPWRCTCRWSRRIHPKASYSAVYISTQGLFSCRTMPRSLFSEFGMYGGHHTEIKHLKHPFKIYFTLFLQYNLFLYRMRTPPPPQNTFNSKLPSKNYFNKCSPASPYHWCADMFYLSFIL